ncbi:MAG: hypothetical protein HWE13_13945 [Gammaproteobacteria bacterium]|nr:hypothetical protein [Gammaproteobacteria bacterium]NVK89233.1 hypothetical protein [Gammaproteobacteria bacterium]
MNLRQQKWLAAIVFGIAALLMIGIAAPWLPGEHSHGAIGLILLVVAAVVLRRSINRSS